MIGVDKVIDEAVGMLIEKLKDIKDKNVMFKATLKKLRITVLNLGRLIREIRGLNRDMDVSDAETSGFAQELEDGVKLVNRCLQVKCYNVFVRAKCTEDLVDLDEALQRWINILLVQAARDTKKCLVLLQTQSVNGDRSNQGGAGVPSLSCRLPHLPSLVIGLDNPVKQLKRMLLGATDMRALVVTAAGGSGKTLLAQKFCDDDAVKERFKDIFFVTVSKTPPSLSLIVQTLYEYKGVEVPASLNEPNAADSLRQLLMDKLEPRPRLLVLDDVWEGSESLIHKQLDLHIPDYKILVTSRSKLSRCEPYTLNPLTDDDAMTLFRRLASLDGGNFNISDETVQKTVNCYKMFPLALKIVASSLSGKPEEVWLTKLQKHGSSRISSESELLSSLQGNLDELKIIFKECFMDLGLFPEDQRIPAAALIDMWTELYDLKGDNNASSDVNAIAMLSDLTNRNLANLIVTREDTDEVDGYYSKHSVTQHDLLRELAIHESIHEPLDMHESSLQNPQANSMRPVVPVELRKRLILELNGDNHPDWCREHKKQLCPLSCFQGNANLKEPFCAQLLSISTDEKFSSNWFDMQLPEAKVLVLNFKTKDYALPKFVRNMNKLKVLIVTNYSFFPAELRNFQLLGSLYDLKRIRLERISIPSLSETLVPLKKLQKLSLFMCSIGNAFSNCSTLLPDLKEMNIDFCYDLRELPSRLCNIIPLKKLSITYCPNLTALPKEIGNLENLEVLRLRSCGYLEELPDSISRLSKLAFLDIYDCNRIPTLPKDFGSLESLTKLNMKKCSRLDELPSSVSDLEQLKDLRVICDEDKRKLWDDYLSPANIKSANAEPNLNFLQNA